ncbi:hypothetical protein [Ruminococcus callidus]|uniref:hypothetical protein n=1 Tax=Ruminococcus callidus TaxID=40519 RepID=UPI0035227CEA
MWNLLLDVKDLQDNPSVTCGASSAQGTPYGCPKGEPIAKGSLILYITPKTDIFSPQCGLRFALQKDRGISWRFPVIFS